MTLERLSVILLKSHEGLFGSLDFGFVMILPTIEPDIEACGLDCAFATHRCDDSNAFRIPNLMPKGYHDAGNTNKSLQ